jgi:GMP synthase PP-ATPase subunit
MKNNSTKEDVSDLDIIIVRLFQRSVESMFSTSSEIALNKIDENDCEMNEIEKTTNDEIKSKILRK